jgi:diacylglycerol kinase family enzyme
MINEMRYAIITNPASGNMTADMKLSILAEAAAILDAEIYGLDTVSADDLSQCAQELINHCDVLVVAGGDGTLSDIINAIDTARVPVAYLPLGTANAMQYALNYKGNLADISMRIKEGGIHRYDLIDCDGKRRAFMTSVGIEGTVAQLRNQYVAQGATGIKTYIKSVIHAYFKTYKRAAATITVDGTNFEVKNLLSLMVVKQPYYGFGLIVMPEARFDDQQLHIRWVNSGLFKCMVGAAASLTIGNRTGHYCPGERVTIKLEHPLFNQIDGNEGWSADVFHFGVLPKALKIKF